jgi:acetylornithine deacetylase/succinyl-diaminopimelate desuccinylase family protein
MNATLPPEAGAALDGWIAAHFDEEVAFLREIVRVPSDTPPGDNLAAADRAAALLEDIGFAVERHAPPQADVIAAGLTSVVNLVVRHRLGTGGPVIALNVHGDVVPPGEGWTHDPYGGEIVDGRMYGRGVAVSKSDFATYTFALRALMNSGLALDGVIELHFTYDEEFGGLLGPAWLLSEGITKPDLALGPGFSYAVVTAHNGCLQLAVTIRGRSAHAAMPETGVDAIRAASVVMSALYAHAESLSTQRSAVEGITSPTLNIGLIEGGINTNVVPDRVTFKLDRRMIPEEDPAEVEATLRRVVAEALPNRPGLSVDVRQLLLARALRPLPGHERLVDAVQAAAADVMGAPLPATATPLYTDARLYGEAGVPIVLYGAGPRTILEANAKRADENLALDDLRIATRVVARALAALLLER